MSTASQQGKVVVQGQVVQGQIIQPPAPPPAQQQQQQQYVASAIHAQPVGLQQQQVQQPETVSNGRVVVTQIPGFEYSHANGWRGGICDCCTVACVPSCVMAYFCPCISLGQLSQKVDSLSFWAVVGIYLAITIVSIIISVTTGYNLNALQGLFLFVVCLIVRQRVRSHLSIPGDGCEDCACSFFCTCCTIAQMTRTVFNYQEGDGCDQCGERGEPRWWLDAEVNRLNQGQQQQQQFVTGQVVEHSATAAPVYAPDMSSNV